MKKFGKARLLASDPGPAPPPLLPRTWMPYVSLRNASSMAVSLRSSFNAEGRAAAAARICKCYLLVSENLRGP